MPISKRKREIENKKTKRASEATKSPESGLRAEAEGRALPDRNAVTREQPSSEPKD